MYKNEYVMKNATNFFAAFFFYFDIDTIFSYFINNVTLIGFLGAATLRGKIRSVFTLIVSVGLSLFIGIVLALGNIFQFT